MSSPQQLYDLFLMGLMWLRNEREEVLARPALSVFSPLVKAGVLTSSQRGLLPRNATLVTMTMKHGEVIKADKRPRKKDLVAKINNSRAHVITLVVPSETLNYAKFFGPRGYLHVITKAGIEQAQSVAGGYSSLIDEPRFLVGWGKHKLSMRSAANRTAGLGPEPGTVEGGNSEPLGYIPKARYSEGDFEW